MPAFCNYWTIGPSTSTFAVNGAAAVDLTHGTLPIWTVLDEFLDLCQATVATLRLSMSNTGHITIDNNGGANFSITFTDAYLALLLGFTTDPAAANTYTAARRMRGAFFLEHGGGPLATTIGDFDAMPELAHLTQTRSLGQVTRTTRSGVLADATPLVLQNIDNTARYVSPSGSYGTTYAAAASTGAGLTAYTHARDLWWDSAADRQGWNDGRPVQYFATSPSITASAAPTMPTADSTWTMDADSCKAWTATRVRPPKTTSYNLSLRAFEYGAT